MSLPAAVWVLLAILWGTTWLAVRLGLEDLPPFTFAGIRFLIASGLLFAVVMIRRLALPTRFADWALILKTGLLIIAVPYASQFWGQQHIPSGLAAVIFTTVPLFTLLFAHAKLPGEPLTRAKLAGVLLGMAGVVLIFSDQLRADSPLALWGCVALLTAALAMAFGQVTVKATGRGIDPAVLAALQMGLGGVLLLGAGLTFEGNPIVLPWSPRAVTALFYLSAIGSAVGFGLFYWLLHQMQVTKVTSMMLVHPVVAVVLGWIVLGESLGWGVLLGAAGILMGLALILRPVSPSVPSRPPIECPDQPALDSWPNSRREVA